jgi:hypothetical protein
MSKIICIFLLIFLSSCKDEDRITPPKTGPATVAAPPQPEATSDLRSEIVALKAQLEAKKVALAERIKQDRAARDEAIQSVVTWGAGLCLIVAIIMIGLGLIYKIDIVRNIGMLLSTACVLALAAVQILGYITIVVWSLIAIGAVVGLYYLVRHIYNLNRGVKYTYIYGDRVTETLTNLANSVRNVTMSSFNSDVDAAEAHHKLIELADGALKMVDGIKNTESVAQKTAGVFNIIQGARK